MVRQYIVLAMFKPKADMFVIIIVSTQIVKPHCIANAGPPVCPSVRSLSVCHI